MGFFDKYFSRAENSAKYLQLQDIGGVATWSENDYTNFVRNGLFGNDLIFQALTIRANSVVDAPLALRDQDKQPLVDDPRLAVFLSPNKYQDSREFLKLVVHYLDLDGNAFILKGRAKRKGYVQEMHLLRPDRVAVVVSKKPGELISYYEYRIGGNTVKIDPSDLIHIKYANPLTPHRGFSPLLPIIQYTEIDNESRSFTKALLENKAVPGGFLKVLTNMTKSQKQRVVESMKRMFGGKNRGTIGVLDGDVEFLKAGMDLNEMNFSHITNLTETRILSALGLNTNMLGLLSGQGGSTFNNVGEAKLSFYQQTIIPLQQTISAALTNDRDLNPDRADSFYFDISEVSALQPVRDARVEMLQTAHDAAKQAVTTNELRAALGLPPVDGGDDLKEDVSMPAAPSVPQEGDQIEEQIEENEEEQDKSLDLEQKRLEIQTEWANKVNNAADKGYTDMVLWSSKWQEEIFEDLMGILDSAEKDLRTDQIEKIEKALDEIQQSWARAIAASPNLPISVIAKDVLQNLDTAPLGISFNVSAEQVQKAVEEYTYKFADRISKTAVKQTRKVMLQAREAGLGIPEIRQALHEEFKGALSVKRAEMIARTETVRAANSGALERYKSAGVKTIRWVASGDSCPYCTGLNGKTVTTGSAFAESGYSPNPGEVKGIDLSYDGGFVQHPPIHPYCRCTIIQGDL